MCDSDPAGPSTAVYSSFSWEGSLDGLRELRAVGAGHPAPGWEVNVTFMLPKGAQAEDRSARRGEDFSRAYENRRIVPTISCSR